MLVAVTRPDTLVWLMIGRVPPPQRVIGEIARVDIWTMPKRPVAVLVEKVLKQCFAVHRSPLSRPGR